jgi:hypothetical protein
LGSFCSAIELHPRFQRHFTALPGGSRQPAAIRRNPVTAAAGKPYLAAIANARRPPMHPIESHPRYEEARRHVKEVRGFYTHALTYVLVIGFLAAMNLTRSPDRLWFLWAAFGWGIGLAAHGLNTFAFRGFLGAAWEERKIREYLDRRG